MRRRDKPRAEKLSSGTLLIVFAVALFVVLLLLRMLVFVTGHGRHHF